MKKALLILFVVIVQTKDGLLYPKEACQEIEMQKDDQIVKVLDCEVEKPCKNEYIFSDTIPVNHKSTVGDENNEKIERNGDSIDDVNSGTTLS